MKLQLKKPCWLEIDLNALEENFNFIKKRIDPKTKIAAVVKANAYNHGAVKIAKKLSQLGIDYFCVGSPDEGIELREAGIEGDILVLAEILKSQYPDIIKGDLIQTAASSESLISLNKFADQAAKIINVHLKIDTGMGRIGFFPEQLSEVFKLAAGLDNIKISGIFSHFARADEKNKEFSFKQLEKFKKVLKEIKKTDFKLPVIHLANSAAIIDLGKSFFDFVRPGIILYGLLPSDQLKNKADLSPLLSFKTKVVQLREMPADSVISYGSTYKTKSREKLAVLAVGYKDGYPRQLSNKGEVLIKGKRAPVRGRVCMGQTIVSVEHIKNIKKGDEVVLIGRQGQEEIKAAEIAEKCGTINYEILCNLNQSLQKIYLDKK